MSWNKLIATLTTRAIFSPTLARDLLKTAWRFRRRAWYKRPPFLPIPDKTYFEWRMYTAYGDAKIVPPVKDIEHYARWLSNS